MSAEINGIPLTHRKGLWFAEVPSKAYGKIEAVLDPSSNDPKESPDPMQAEALRRFTKDIDTNVNKVRSKLFLSFLFRPVCLAPNKKGKIAVKFKNILTGDDKKTVME